MTLNPGKLSFYKVSVTEETNLVLEAEDLRKQKAPSFAKEPECLSLGSALCMTPDVADCSAGAVITFLPLVLHPGS